MSNQVETNNSNLKIPHVNTLTQASKIALEFDRPIMLDYYCAQARIVKTKEGDTILYKSNDEYTSPLGKLLKVDNSQSSDGTCDLIAMSENSVYLVTSRVLPNNN